MDSRLVKFLERFTVKPKELYTHTSMITPRRSYFIPGTELDTFWSIYGMVLHDQGVAGLTEKPDDCLPLIMDIDLRYDLNMTGMARQYTEDTVTEVVQVYQEEISKILDPNQTLATINRALICILLEKNVPRAENGEIRDGFHLHFPFCSLEQKVHRYLRQKVLDQFTVRRTFSRLNLAHDKLDKIFDAGIPGVNWLLYGSRKSPTHEIWKITKIYDHQRQEIELTTILAVKPDATTSSSSDEIQGHVARATSSLYMNRTIIIFEKGNSDELEWRLPRFLSVRNSPYNIKVTDGLRLVARKKEKKIAPHQEKTLEEILVDLTQANELLGMISKDRSDSYISWMEIGWILFNISQGHDRGLEIWIRNSRSSKKFVGGECEELWDKMHYGNYTIGTLRMMASQDAPEHYHHWKEKQLFNVLSRASGGLDYSMACVLQKYYEDRVICVSIERKIWYEFHGNRWRQMDSGTAIWTALSTVITGLFVRLVEPYFNKKVLELGDDPDRQTYIDKKKKLSEVLCKLQTNAYKRNVMVEAMHLFHQAGGRDFLPKLDSNPDTVCFDNGVYDLKMHQFREGRPEDYCSFSVGYDYHEPAEEDKEEVRELFKKVFVNRALREYYFRYAASCLRGGNSNKVFVIWTGERNNAKTIIGRFMEITFGDYAIHLPTSLLSGRRTQSSSATPELARTAGRRIVFISEPDKGEVFNLGIIKELSGSDTIYVRPMYRDGFEVIPLFKFVYTCNDMPTFLADDPAFFERLRVLPFESTFMDGAPKDPKMQFKLKQFPKDPYYRDKLPQLRMAFMWLLLEEYKEYAKHGLHEPMEVKVASNEYRKDNDIFLQFVTDTVVEQNGGRISPVDLYAIFRDWFRSGFPGTRLPPRPDLVKYLTKRWGKLGKSGRWRGFSLREATDIVSDDEPDDVLIIRHS